LADIFLIRRTSAECDQRVRPQSWVDTDANIVVQMPSMQSPRPHSWGIVHDAPGSLGDTHTAVVASQTPGEQALTCLVLQLSPVNVDRATAVVVSGLSNALQLTGGGLHACAALSDGSARCWGVNGQGQVGDGPHPNDSLRWKWWASHA